MVLDYSIGTLYTMDDQVIEKTTVWFGGILGNGKAILLLKCSWYMGELRYGLGESLSRNGDMGHIDIHTTLDLWVHLS